ncbi:MAG: dCTP deaminase [SAR86 cluster bacterium]|uniref:dCTP deaminase n=1 Tax=SAR86 cluster bacterium TaxID=2030880 RepID=A0A2A5AN96_9GAMM|nr:MAG: dCTP deaminase [SAR86 cluster bacterium]
MNEISDGCKRLFFEVFERTLRFWSHVQGARAQAARPNRRVTAQEAIARTLNEGLAQILKMLLKVVTNDQLSDQQKINLIHAALLSLAEFHKGPLSAVPRPHEPIELVSYIRQALNSYPDQNERKYSPPHVYATEDLGDQAHARFDSIGNDNFNIASELTIAANHPSSLKKELEQYLLSDDTLDDRESHSETNSGIDSIASSTEDKSIGYISLPRVDFRNPLRWPSLIHEAGHFESGAHPERIWEHFSKLQGGALKPLALVSMNSYLNSLDSYSPEPENEIKKWLVECWCDAHAARVAGAPALFSQMHAFLFSNPCYLTEPAKGKGYPPAWFRLRLMRALITTRHSTSTKSNNLIKTIISEEWTEIENIFPAADGANVVENSNLTDLFVYFYEFLTNQFPQDEWLNQSDIHPDLLKELIEDVGLGLPIPTHRNFNGSVQIPTSQAEILLAGWSFRNSKFKNSLFQILIDEDFCLKNALPKLLSIVDRADSSLQMSIQVSEWFEILTSPEDHIDPLHTEQQIESVDVKPLPTGLLTDRDIVTLLHNNSLRVIPLIGGTGKIEGTTIDVRLGHNFEVFFTNISGAMDALDNSRRNVVDSMEVDYDSLEGLEIAPGQFVLGHTLEYLKLPRDVAAEVNGRSSFARLGIDIHKTAPNVEAGFDGCLTLEIVNSGHSAVKLYPGMRIAQLRFYRCSSSPKVSYGDKSGVKYRGRLRHNKTEQFHDWEIEAFNKARKKRERS